MTDTDHREAINALVDKFGETLSAAVDEAVNEVAETLAEAVDEALTEVEDRAVEAAYQDGLNDALAELRAYREQLTADECDQAYIDGIDDAISTLRTAGAVDSDTTETTPAADESLREAAPACVVGDSNDDADGM